MNENNTKKEFENAVQALATQFSLTRIQLESLEGKFEFRLDEAQAMKMISQKAIIRVLGKKTVVSIGEGEKYQTYEEALVGVREHWSEYFKQRRERRTDAERLGEARRQKRYRDRKKLREAEFRNRK